MEINVYPSPEVGLDEMALSEHKAQGLEGIQSGTVRCHTAAEHVPVERH